MTHEEYKQIEDQAIEELFRIWKNKQVLVELEGQEYVDRKIDEILAKYDMNNLIFEILGVSVNFLERAKDLYQMTYGERP